MKTENTSILAQALAMLPVVHAAFDGAVGVAVADTEKILKYLPAKNLDFRTPLNSPIAEGSGLERLLRQNLTRLTARIGSQLHGVPYVVRIGAIPGIAGKVVGALVISQATDRQERFRFCAEMLKSQLAALSGVGESLRARGASAPAVNRSSAVAIADRVNRIGQELQKAVQLLEQEAESA